MTSIISDEDRIAHDLFPGDECSIKLRAITIKKARKEHECFLSMAYGGVPHNIQPGERYRHEKALIDSDFWGVYKCCLKCVDREIRDLSGDEE